MNIPPDDQQNDLNRGPPPPPPHPIIGAFQNIFTQLFEANREWTDVKDFAFRLAVPLFSIAAVALINRQLEKRDRLISEGEQTLKLAKDKLAAERKVFDAVKESTLNRPLVEVANELMAEGNKNSYKVLQEIDSLHPLIQDVLKIRCSLTTSRENRFPIEREIRTRLLRPASPLDMYGSLKGQILEDTIEIVNQSNHGDLYKVYKDNWRLRVELEKHKQVIEQLKRASRNNKV